MRGSRPASAVVAAVLLHACVFGKGDAKPSSTNGIGDRNLAVPAQSVPSEATSASSSGASTDASTPDSSNPSNPTSPRQQRLVAIADTAGDVGGEGPGYADAVEVTIDDDGTAARIRVRMRTTVPLTLGEGEVIGVGVNLDSAQVFADGESDGWYAYLQVGDHFLTYPGTFELAGDTLIFTVPWGVLNDPSSGTVDGFVDWSKPLIGKQAQSSADRMPDTGGISFTR